MNKPVSKKAYYRDAETWAADREKARRAGERVAWIVAGTASIIALAEALALMAIAPLKTVVPYTLLVDRQTGNVQELKPLERDVVSADAALTRSFLAQYVIAREGFQIESLKNDYRKVALWSAGEAREQYTSLMRASNPASPLSRLPRNAVINVEVNSVSSLNPQTSIVRFVTYRVDAAAGRQRPVPYSAVLTHRYSGKAMSAADRLTNPLGFQVVRYRKSADIPLQPAGPDQGERPNIPDQVIQ